MFKTSVKDENVKTVVTIITFWNNVCTLQGIKILFMAVHALNLSERGKGDGKGGKDVRAIFVRSGP